MKFVLVTLLVFVASLADAAATSIKNFHQVSPGVYRGARPFSAGLHELSKMGVRTILNLQGGDGDVLWFTPLIRVMQPGELPRAIQNERRLAVDLGMTFLNFPTNSFLSVDATRAEGIQKALAALADPANHPVFIHCEFGKDRTGLIVALYRVFHQGWSAHAAHNEMVALGHSGVNGFFTSALDDYFFEATAAVIAPAQAAGF